MRPGPFLAALAATLALAGHAGAGDPQAGQAKARPCATCHGREGIGTAPHYPNLAGQKSLYLIQQLEAFRSGARASEVMKVMAEPLSDEDIGDLAAYYESLRPECACQ